MSSRREYSLEFKESAVKLLLSGGSASEVSRDLGVCTSLFNRTQLYEAGSGTRPKVISPVMNNILITIIGMFFGNQMVKR